MGFYGWLFKNKNMKTIKDLKRAILNILKDGNYPEYHYTDKYLVNDLRARIMGVFDLFGMKGGVKRGKSR